MASISFDTSYGPLSTEGLDLCGVLELSQRPPDARMLTALGSRSAVRSISISFRHSRGRWTEGRISLFKDLTQLELVKMEDASEIMMAVNKKTEAAILSKLLPIVNSPEGRRQIRALARENISSHAKYVAKQLRGFSSELERDVGLLLRAAKRFHVSEHLVPAELQEAARFHDSQRRMVERLREFAA